MSTVLKTALPLLRPLIPYLTYLPTPLLTILPTLALHATSHPSPNPLTFLRDPLTHPLHAPLIFLWTSIPLIYVAGLISGNVSWVDRLWPFYTPICSGMVVAWAWLNQGSGVYGHNLPRLGLMMALQVLWSIRLLSHASKRGFYDLKGEDYRYTQFRKVVPSWLMAFVHLFVIALAQPVLLFTLCLPLHAILVLPPTELSSGPLGISIPYSAFLPFLPASISTPSHPSVPVLHLGDLLVTFLAMTCLYVEYSSDKQQYKFQESKHAPLPSIPDSSASSTSSAGSSSSSSKPCMIHPNPGELGYSKYNFPKPTSYPSTHAPGFVTTGWWEWSRHPNFAAEQLFWVTQALFVVGAGRSSGVTKSGWVGGMGGVWGPCFGLSVLFCASTFLTECITESKYPKYKAYRGLVGQFLPQETLIKYLWSTITGSRQVLKEMVYGTRSTGSSKGAPVAAR